MNGELLSMIGFDSHFPAMPKPADPYANRRDDDAARAAHVAKVAPQLERLYTVTPDKIANAFDHVSMYLVERHPALVAALATREHAEIGRLLLAGMDRRFKALADDAAEEESYDVVPL